MQLKERNPLPDDASTAIAGGAVPPDDVWSRLPRPLTGAIVPAAALVATSIATLLGAGLSHWLPQQSIALVYMLVVVATAVGLGLRTGMTVAVLSFLAFNFFFIPPVFTFTIADPQELFALIVFLAVALLTGSLAGRMREVADYARHKSTALQSLNDFAGTLSGSIGLPAILDALAEQAAETIQGEAVVLTGNAEGLFMSAAAPTRPILAPVDFQAAQRAYRAGETTHAAAPGWDGARFEFHPIKTSAGTLGVVGIAAADRKSPIRTEHQASLELMLRHTAIAIDRTQLEAEAVRAREETERERLRSALLSSLSHDLRTPLASILGSVTSLRELGAGMAPEARADLLAAIEEEARRMSRFVSNLLHMTRLETGDIDLLSDWIDIADVVRTAVTRARRIAPQTAITLTCPPTLSAIKGDATLLELVVLNLLDNSIKFSSGGQSIDVVVSAVDHAIALSVTDAGCGIPVEALPKVFETFFRARKGDGEMPGTGLGLAICKRVVDGMGGTITVESPISGHIGTRVTVKLPVPAGIAAVAAEPGDPRP